MPRFYFHIRDGQHLISDLEGVELPSSNAAFDEAQSAAKEILAEKVKRGEIINGHAFEICDEEGTRLFTMPLKWVLRLK